MSTPTATQHFVVHNTFVLERTYPVPVDRVYAAFADRGKKRRWFAEGNHHEVQQFEMDFRVGGTERAQFRFKEGTPIAGAMCTNHSVYQDIVPDRRVVTASTMSIGDQRISASLVTAEFLPEANGTRLILTHQGAFFEGADGPEMRQTGWRALLDRLAAELTR